MAGNKTSVKLQRGKIRTTSPTRSQTSETPSPPDLSILRKSIKTSITGFSHARDLFDTGTNELKQLLSAECDIIYECKVCRNLFRSLANFISHKRVYCMEKFDSAAHPHFANDNHMKEDINTILEFEEDFQEFIKNRSNVSNGTDSDDSTAKKKYVSKDLTSIIERLLKKTQSESSNGQKDGDLVVPIRRIKLQAIPDSNTAIYQTIFNDRHVPDDSIRDQIDELNELISSNEAILGPDGKLLSHNHLDFTKLNDSNSKSNQSDKQLILHCGICKINFSTQKTLKCHMKIKHAENRLVYPCPDCSDTFSNSWSVFRHLFKVHRKSATHIRKMRETIHNKAFRLNMSDMADENRKSPDRVQEAISEQQRMDQENQAWIDNLEGDGDIPRCGGCGKSFERRAALSAHRQTCQLRKNAQNKLNNNQKRTIPKVLTREPDEPMPMMPLKIPKLEKPTEKRIEIKIRKDYNKSNLVMRTASPAVADESLSLTHLESMDSSYINSVIGENSYDYNSIHFDTSNIKTEPDYMENDKDCDDANVDDFEKNLYNSDDDNDEQKYTEDELNYDDIKRICDGNRSPVKACGQKLKIDLNIVKQENDSIVGNELDNYQDEVPSKVERGKFFCEYCNAQFKLKAKLVRHIMQYQTSKKFECKLCNIKCCSTALYEKHMKSEHRLTVRLRKIKKKVDIPFYDEDATDSFLDVLEQGSNLSDPIEEDSNSDYADLSKYKMKKRLKHITKHKKIIKRRLNIKKNMLSPDSDIDKLQVSHFSELEPMWEEVIGKIKNTIPIKLRDSSAKSGIKIKRLKKKNNVINVKIKKLDQHIASSESCAIQRPVRNRVKPFDKDFEYDSSYMPKSKTDKDTPATSVVSSSKSNLKRKQFLQTEIVPEEMVKLSEESDLTTDVKQESTIPEHCRGALRAMSTSEASRARSAMRIKVQATTARRNTPPFIRTQYAPTAEPEGQKTPMTSCPPSPTDEGSPEKTGLRLKTIPMKIVRSPSTVSKISEKSYLDKIQQKIGMPVSLLPQKLTVLTRKTEGEKIKRPRSPSKKKKSLPTKNQDKNDHQALSRPSKLSEIQSNNLTADGETDTSSSLSILPANGKSSNSSFVNISLKQLKNLQKGQSPFHIPDGDLESRNSFALKNLVGNNEIRISKVASLSKLVEVKTPRKKRPKEQTIRKYTRKPKEKIIIPEKDPDTSADYLPHDADFYRLPTEIEEIINSKFVDEIQSPDPTLSFVHPSKKFKYDKSRSLLKTSVEPCGRTDECIGKSSD